MRQVNCAALKVMSVKRRELVIKRLTDLHYQLVRELPNSSDPTLQDTLVGLAFTLTALGSEDVDLDG